MPVGQLLLVSKEQVGKARIMRRKKTRPVPEGGSCHHIKGDDSGQVVQGGNQKGSLTRGREVGGGEKWGEREIPY